MARRLNTHVAYLSQVANGHRKAGHEFVKKVEKDTGRLVTRHDLRPDIFGQASESTEAA